MVFLGQYDFNKERKQRMEYSIDWKYILTLDGKEHRHDDEYNAGMTFARWYNRQGTHYEVIESYCGDMDAAKYSGKWVVRHKPSNRILQPLPLTLKDVIARVKEYEAQDRNAGYKSG